LHVLEDPALEVGDPLGDRGAQPVAYALPLEEGYFGFGEAGSLSTRWRCSRASTRLSRTSGWPAARRRSRRWTWPRHVAAGAKKLGGSIIIRDRLVDTVGKPLEQR